MFEREVQQRGAMRPLEGNFVFEYDRRDRVYLSTRSGKTHSIYISTADVLFSFLSLPFPLIEDFLGQTQEERFSKNPQKNFSKFLQILMSDDKKCRTSRVRFVLNFRIVYEYFLLLSHGIPRRVPGGWPSRIILRLCYRDYFWGFWRKGRSFDD